MSLWLVCEIISLCGRCGLHSFHMRSIASSAHGWTLSLGQSWHQKLNGVGHGVLAWFWKMKLPVAQSMQQGAGNPWHTPWCDNTSAPHSIGPSKVNDGKTSRTWPKHSWSLSQVAGAWSRDLPPVPLDCSATASLSTAKTARSASYHSPSSLSTGSLLVSDSSDNFWWNFSRPGFCPWFGPTKWTLCDTCSTDGQCHSFHPRGPILPIHKAKPGLIRKCLFRLQLWRHESNLTCTKLLVPNCRKAHYGKLVG